MDKLVLETEDRGERPRSGWKRWRAGIRRGEGAIGCLHVADDDTEKGAVLKVLSEYRQINAEDAKQLDQLSKEQG